MPPEGFPRVLVVDDEPGVAGIVRRTIERSFGQARVVTASSGDEALRILGRESFDLLLTDQYMPGITGLEVAAEARKRNPDLPILLMTGDADRDLAMAAMNTLDAENFLPKPFTYDELVGAVEAALVRVR